MATQTILVITHYIIFITMFSVIAVFLMVQILKAEKIARPLLFSLFIYFLFLTIANTFQMLKYIEAYTLGQQYLYDQKVSSLMLSFFAAAAPLLLIFQVEKKFLVERKIFSQYHVFFAINVISLAVIIISAIIMGITDPTSLINVGVTTFGPYVLPLHIAVLVFVIATFGLLALKSTGKYRTFAFMIALGWTINQILNAFHQFLPGALLNDVTTTIIFIGKYIGMIVTAVGFYKLYSLQK